MLLVFVRRGDNRYAGSPGAHGMAYLFGFNVCHHVFFIILSQQSEVKVEIGKNALVFCLTN